jgi:hypothetical protein
MLTLSMKTSGSANTLPSHWTEMLFMIALPCWVVVLESLIVKFVLLRKENQKRTVIQMISVVILLFMQ